MPVSEPARPAVTLRGATAEDVETIARVWHDGWGDGHLGHVPGALVPHRRLEDFHLRVPSRVPYTTVAVVGGRVVGFVTVQDDEVEQVYVSAGARGLGIADALLAHAEREIAGRYRLAWLAVVAGNARARRFYERSGWQQAEAFDYDAEIAGGTLVVPSLRYEKTLGIAGGRG